jgi:polyisoprenoid-binding protein YceI
LKRWLLWGALGVVLAGGVAVAWLWFAGGSGEPSTDLTTPPIADDPTTTAGDGSPTVAPGDGTSFVIDPSRSTASYEVDEILRGSPNRVVGVTDQVAGQVVFDPADLGTVRFSEIVVNARTFETDSSLRDRQVRGPIVLDSASDQFELITFRVSSVDGLPDAAEVGSPVSAEVVGDLTIKGTTREVVFDLTVAMTDESTLTGSATTVVLRSDFGIGIPQVPSVAGVDEEVTLVLDFVAVAG